jgi:hypothetical protein
MITILIVDDEAAVRDSLRKTLEYATEDGPTLMMPTSISCCLISRCRVWTD